MLFFMARATSKGVCAAAMSPARLAKPVPVSISTSLRTQRVIELNRILTVEEGPQKHGRDVDHAENYLQHVHVHGRDPPTVGEDRPCRDRRTG